MAWCIAPKPALRKNQKILTVQHLPGYSIHSILESMAGNNKILIVEDDRNLLDTLKYNLRKDCLLYTSDAADE